MIFCYRYTVFQLYPPIISSTLSMKYSFHMVLYFLRPLLPFPHSSVTRCSLSFPVAVLLNVPLCHSFLGSLCGCFMLCMFTLVGHGLHLRYCGGAFSVGVLRYASVLLFFDLTNQMFCSLAHSHGLEFMALYMLFSTSCFV